MSETSKRLASGLSLGAIVVVALSFPDVFYSFPVIFLVMTFSLLGVVEFYSLTDRGLEGRAMKSVGTVFAILFVLAFYIQYVGARVAAGQPAPGYFRPELVQVSSHIIVLLFVLLVVTTMSSHLIWRPLDGTTYGVTITIFGVLYTCIPFCLVFLILAVDRGVFFLVLIALATIMTDAGAYFSGRWFGKHNAGLQVSPRKTFEGYIGGFCFSIAFNIGYLYFWRKFASEHNAAVNISYLEVAIFTGGLSVLSVFGDLVESALKRDARKKDSASLIPGHGGMLDLADALYFSLPVGYYYLYFRHILGYSL